jgi:hypothetical protein
MEEVMAKRRSGMGLGGAHDGDDGDDDDDDDDSGN